MFGPYPRGPSPRARGAPLADLRVYQREWPKFITFVESDISGRLCRAGRTVVPPVVLLMGSSFPWRLGHDEQKAEVSVVASSMRHRAGHDVLAAGWSMMKVMPPSPSSSAQAARQRLGDRLRRLRLAARVSGVEFARRAGWSSSAMVTMVEKGQKPINGEHVRLWCQICGAEAQELVELLAEQAAVSGMWATHAELNQAGLKARQERVRDEYWQVRLHRVYQTRVPPGLLQTRGMMTYLLTRVRLEQRVAIDDVAEAVEARLERQRCLRRPEARWLFLLEEDVLWYRLAPIEVHREQLHHLLEMMRYPTVSLGVIPRTAERRGAVAGESFSMNDTDLVSIELISGYLNLTMPADMRLYVEAWERFARIAVHGERARALILAALETLDCSAEGG